MHSSQKECRSRATNLPLVFYSRMTRARVIADVENMWVLPACSPLTKSPCSKARACMLRLWVRNLHSQSEDDTISALWELNEGRAENLQKKLAPDQKTLSQALWKEVAKHDSFWHDRPSDQEHLPSLSIADVQFGPLLLFGTLTLISPNNNCPGKKLKLSSTPCIPLQSPLLRRSLAILQAGS